MHSRQTALHHWLLNVINTADYELTPLTGDASFRRYYRLHYLGEFRIVMDAPPDKETVGPFLHIARLLSEQGIHAPHVYAADEQQGFIVLEDLGDTLLLSILQADNADKLYRQAMDIILRMQASIHPLHAQIPCFDKAYMLQELQLFITWFLNGYLKLTLSDAETKLINSHFQLLVTEISAQPQVFIHRDYHSRNIMFIERDGQFDLGIIDFQDAMQGPLAYDLVSLLKDCYIQWPREQVLDWAALFYSQSPIAQQMTLPAFIQGFERCGLQRHLKVLGIFSRLYLRDNKPGYLNDIPLVLNYVMSALEPCAEWSEFYQFMLNRVRLP